MSELVKRSARVKKHSLEVRPQGRIAIAACMVPR